MSGKRKTRASNKRKRKQSSSEEESDSGDETSSRDSSSSSSSSEEEDERTPTPKPKPKRKHKKPKAKPKHSRRKKLAKPPAKKRKRKPSLSDGKQSLNMGAGITLTYSKLGVTHLKHRFWKYYKGRDQTGAKDLPALLEKVKNQFWQPTGGDKDPASELNFWSIDNDRIHARNIKRGSTASIVERKQPSFFCSLCPNQGRVG
jgi:hypothetical protein